jgi:UDP-N-acetylmuramate dehydrogenase
MTAMIIAPELIAGRLANDVPLAPLTTIGIGGPARHFLRATTVDEVAAAVGWAAARGLPLLVLAGGSNLLIADKGFDGLVLQVALKGNTVISEDRDFVQVKAAAGEEWDPFVEHAVLSGWAGVECLSGIPGWIGATPIQNVGAYGQDVSETIARVEALDRDTARVRSFTNGECRFGYRGSLFKNEEPNRYIILSVVFRLRRGGLATVRYPELQQFLEERGESADDLRAVRGAVIAIRRRKGMVLDLTDPDTRSDGSFFMNPIVSEHAFASFLRKARAALGNDVKVPNFPAGEGKVKLSAAWLIERAGFSKGFVLGNAGLSSKHVLAIINRGGATAREVVELARLIRDGVRTRFGIELQPEPNLVGLETSDG